MCYLLRRHNTQAGGANTLMTAGMQREKPQPPVTAWARLDLVKLGFCQWGKVPCISGRILQNLGTAILNTLSLSLDTSGTTRCGLSPKVHPAISPSLLDAALLAVTVTARNAGFLRSVNRVTCGFQSTQNGCASVLATRQSVSIPQRKAVQYHG